MSTGTVDPLTGAVPAVASQAPVEEKRVRADPLGFAIAAQADAPSLAFPGIPWLRVP